MTAMTKSCAAAAGLYCGLGLQVPIVPTACAVVAVVVVRCLLWSKNQSIIWNFAVMGLSALASFATIEGSSMNTFRAFWVGVAYGAIGVGIIEIGKNAGVAALKDRFVDAGRVLLGIKPAEDHEEEPKP